MIKLYDLERSGNCYKARLMLSLLGQRYERVSVDISKGEQKLPEFLSINPLGSVPVVEDNGVVVRDSAAILVYLGSKYGKGKWYPDTPKAMAKIQQWLAVSSNEIFHGLALTRAMKLALRPGDPTANEAVGKRVMGLLEARLKDHKWLATAEASVADIACYPYAAMMAHVDFPLGPFPSVQAWFKRIEALEGYTPIPAPPPPKR